MASVSGLKNAAVLPPKRRLTRAATISSPTALGHDIIRCEPGEFEKYRKSDEELKSLKNRKLREYYERQNAILDGFKEVEEVLTSTLADKIMNTFSHPPISDGPSVVSPTAVDQDQAERQPLLPSTETKEMKRERMDKIALNVNILREDVGAKFPTGKKRFEPLGVLIFSVCMIASFSQVFVESVKKLFAGETGEIGTVSTLGKATMVATILIKGVIWIWCGRFQSSGIQALAQDAKNDVFFNIFSLIIPWVGEILSIRQLDPLGGALLSLYIISEWVHTLLENFVKLSGRIASSDHHFRILYLISKFKPVVQVSYMEVYHAGDELIVEVDVILPPHTSLTYAHDVGYTIQASIEALDLVSRA
ncbi:Cation diffusion facilitator [Mycena sanguinolenta]|uniref:Cation diffusion facilitator n=1 Tax=Mycena sanguinolenta TaxID=230812 RepID=A0A8H6YGQ1_9AGAR|nr:Cation diffusion facilitator [Mycena sanguinolenta]